MGATAVARPVVAERERERARARGVKVTDAAAAAAAVAQLGPDLGRGRLDRTEALSAV